MKNEVGLIILISIFDVTSPVCLRSTVPVVSAPNDIARPATYTIAVPNVATITASHGVQFERGEVHFG